VVLSDAEMGESPIAKEADELRILQIRLRQPVRLTLGRRVFGDMTSEATPPRFRPR
jgi:hypothetical protein